MSLSILLLEDSDEKARQISAAAASVPGISSKHIVHAPNVAEAKRLLLDRRFDVFLLDLMVPIRQGEPIRKDGGVKLLREIISSSVIQRPRFIVGITAHSEIAEEFEKDFADHLFGLVTYEPAASAWRSTVINVLSHALASDTRTEERVDLCALCALDAPELDSLLRLPIEWKRLQIEDDSSTYYKATIECRGAARSIIAAAAPQMGMPAAAATAAKAICRFSPRYLAMTGILAGFSSRTNIGDAVIADTSWDYGSGKIRSSKKGQVEFLPEPTQIPLDPLLKSQLKQLASDTQLLATVRQGWPGAKPDTTLNVRFGPVASGAAVVAASKIGEAVASQHRKVIGLDMETFAIYFAAMHAQYPRPYAISVKGVCDFADEHKNDDYQGYASYVSAMLLYEWAHRFL